MPPGTGNKPLFEGKATLMSWSSDLLSGGVTFVILISIS